MGCNKYKNKKNYDDTNLNIALDNLTRTEYEALSKEEKGRDGIVYNNITNDIL